MAYGDDNPFGIDPRLLAANGIGGGPTTAAPAPAAPALWPGTQVPRALVERYLGIAPAPGPSPAPQLALGETTVEPEGAQGDVGGPEDAGMGGTPPPTSGAAAGTPGPSAAGGQLTLGETTIEPEARPGDAAPSEEERSRAGRQALIDLASQPFTDDPINNIKVAQAQRQLGELMQLEAEEAQRRAVEPLIEEQAVVQRAVEAERADRDASYTALLQRNLMESQLAVDNIIAETPDPDALLGGQGTWGRALILALQANASQMGIPGVATLVENELRMQMASQESRFEGAKARLAGLQGQVGATKDAIEAGHRVDSARLDAVTKMTALRIAQMAERFADPIARARLLQTSSQLMLNLENKQLMEAKKNAAEIEKLHAEAGKANRAGRGGGVGGPTYPTSGNGNRFSINDWMKRNGIKSSNRDLIVVLDPSDPDGAALAQDPVTAKATSAVIAGSRLLYTVLSKIKTKRESFGSDVFGWSEWLKSDEAKSMDSDYGFAIGAIKEAMTLGALDKGVMDFAKMILGPSPSSWREGVPEIATTMQNVQLTVDTAIEKIGDPRRVRLQGYVAADDPGNPKWRRDQALKQRIDGKLKDVDSRLDDMIAYVEAEQAHAPRGFDATMSAKRAGRLYPGRAAAEDLLKGLISERRAHRKEIARLIKERDTAKGKDRSRVDGKLLKEQEEFDQTNLTLNQFRLWIQDERYDVDSALMKD